MKQVTANVHVEDQFSVPPVALRGSNPGFVTTSEGVVIIDPPRWPTHAGQWRKDLAKIGEVRYIINTHHHIDHIAGNFFFPGTVISHEGVRELLMGPVTDVIASERIKQAAEASKAGYGLGDYICQKTRAHDPECRPLLENYRVREPTITFSENLNLYVGGHTFELIHMPGHTPSHIGVYIPQEKVFFAGDNFTSKTQPSFAHSLPLKWVESLEKIEAMDIDVVVPGHGEVCDKREIRVFRSFLLKCIDMVREAIQLGMSEEEAVDRLSFEELHPGKEEALAVHPGPEMQRRNILRLYEMLSKGGNPSF